MGKKTKQKQENKCVFRKRGERERKGRKKEKEEESM